MSKQCEIVQDLLPLYVDKVCSEASVEMIKEHLASCPSCNEIYRQMCSHTNEDILQKEKDGVINRHERKESQKIIKYIFFAIALIYVPALLLVSLFSEVDGTFIALTKSFVLLVFFVYTVPYYVAFIEFGRLICRALDKRKITVCEKIFNLIGSALAVAIVIVGIVTAAFERDDLINLSLALAGLLVISWVVSAIIYKKKPKLKATLKDKTFWLCVLILMLVIALVVSISTAFLAKQNVREEPLEVGYSIGYRDSGSEYEGVYFDIGAEEQHSWDVIGEKPSFTVKWVNSTENSIEYDMKCYVYKQTNGGWGLCSSDYIDFPATVYILPAGGSAVQQYSIDGYEITESGRYKFVTFVDDKAIWVEFEVTIENANIIG